jgi:GTP cyclohydrolase II
MTNNPRKLKALKEMGITVSEIVPLRVKKNPYNESYLAAKVKKLGHIE